MDPRLRGELYFDLAARYRRRRHLHRLRPARPRNRPARLPQTASTPSDPAAAIATGTAALLEQSGVAPGAIELVVHGTTISLNAILQRRGAAIALVVSPGNRDLLEIARVRMNDPYGFFAVPETPLVRRDRVLELGARLDRDGAVVQQPDAAAYDALGLPARGDGRRVGRGRAAQRPCQQRVRASGRAAIAAASRHARRGLDRNLVRDPRI